MIIGIRTLYNSENCGSFWQAYALGEQLERMGHTVGFMRRPAAGTSHSPSRCAAKCAKALLKGGFASASTAFATHRSFSRAVKALHVIPSTPERVDAIVLGSDTIWQLDSDYFLRNFERYWAVDAIHSRAEVVAYAPSIANSPSELFERSNVSEALDAMKAIGVRDSYTKETLQPLTKREIVEVCDPTLLLSADDYLSLSRRDDQEPYLFAYYFTREVPSDLVDETKKYAESRGLRVISYFGGPLGFGEPSCSVDPYEFLRLMAGASVVVTNTFHGTIFSQIFGKPTVFNSSGKQKVRDMVEKFGLEQSDYAATGSAAGLFDIPYNRDAVERSIERMRTRSIKFLTTAFGVEPEGGR